IGLIITTSFLLLTHSVSLFWTVGLIMGLFIGPLYATSRTYMAHAAPKKLRTQMFGLMAFSGKASTFVGPFLVGWLTYISGSRRLGMSIIIILFIAGFALLLRVPDIRGNKK